MFIQVDIDKEDLIQNFRENVFDEDIKDFILALDQELENEDFNFDGLWQNKLDVLEKENNKLRKANGATLGSEFSTDISKNDQKEANREAKEIVKEKLEREGFKEADEVKKQLETTFQKYLQNIVREGDISLLDLKKPISNSHTTLNQDSRGIIALTKNTSLTIFSRKSDITTIIHEKAHEYERVLTKDEIKILEQWSGYKHGTTDFSEAFAKGAEKVIYGGIFGNEDVNNIFQKLAKWFREVIENAFDYFYSLNDMNSDVIEIYRKMLLKSPTQQQQYQDLKSNPELANAVYSKILTNSGLSAKNLLSLLLKENLIEKQCS